MLSNPLIKQLSNSKSYKETVLLLVYTVVVHLLGLTTASFGLPAIVYWEQWQLWLLSCSVHVAHCGRQPSQN